MGGGRLDILLARNSSFCMGVRRAVKLTLDAANDHAGPRPIGTVGPLIHNRQVLDLLEGKGVIVLEERGETRAGTAIIRAHGISPSARERLAGRAERIIDATCPHVRKVQKIAEKYCSDGYHCIVVGDAGHAEVEGVLRHAHGRGVVVSRPEDLEGLPPMDKVVVVAQTTQNVEMFAEMVGSIRRRYPDCRVFDTICRATQLRQAEAQRLAREVDAMVVVGGFNSANTRRLAQICTETGTLTYHVETDGQLPLNRLLQCGRIGVTAGASTPRWMIRRVLHRIRSEHERRRRSLSYLMRLILAVPVWTNIFIGGGAAAMVYASGRLMGLLNPHLGPCMALAFFFVMAQHLLNQYAKREAMYLNEPDRGIFFLANAGLLRVLGLASGGAALLLAALLGWLPFALVLAGTVGGLLYSLPVGQDLLRRLPLRGVLQLPGSKELSVGLAWAVTTALVPAIVAGALPSHWRGVLVAVLFLFLVAFQRTLLTDLGDMEGDQILGRDSLALLLGEKACRGLLAVVLAAEALVLLGGALLGWTEPVSYLLLIGVAYWAAAYVQLCRGKLPEAQLGEAVIDTKFYLCGLLALWSTVLW